MPSWSRSKKSQCCCRTVWRECFSFQPGVPSGDSADGATFARAVPAHVSNAAVRYLMSEHIPVCWSFELSEFTKGFLCSVMGTSGIEATTPSSPFVRRSECLMISDMFLLSGMLSVTVRSCSSEAQTRGQMGGITNIIVLFGAWTFACESYLGTVMFRYHDVTLVETALSQ